MAKVIVALALALVCAQERPGQDRPQQPGQDRPGTERGTNQDLDSALTKAGQMNNYTANITLRKDAMADPSREPGREPGGREPGGKDQPGRDLGNQPIEVRVMPNQPVFIKSGELEGYRKDNVFILKEGGAWKKIEGDMPRDDKGAKGEISGHKLAKIRAPHEVLRNLKSSSFKSVRREDSEGGRVFSGELNETALRQILADKKDIGQATGNAKIWLGRDGAVSKMELVIDHKAAPGKTDAEGGKMTKTIEFRDVNSTKYEVPADATKTLGGTSTDRPTNDRGDKSEDKNRDNKDKPEDKPMDEPKKEDPKY